MINSKVSTKTGKFQFCKVPLSIFSVVTIYDETHEHY